MNTPTLTARLFEMFASRKMEKGKQLIRAHIGSLDLVKAKDPCAGLLFLALGPWIEYSEIAANTARRLATDFKQRAWPELSLRAWGAITVGMAWLALYENDDSELERACDWVKRNAKIFDAGAELVGTIEHVHARFLAQRRADYRAALERARSACRCFEEAGLPGLLAVAEDTEAWILSQLGNVQDATRIWEQASTILKTLKDAQDWVLLGNIRFAQARDFCRRGSEPKGRAAYIESIDYYSRCQPHHRNLARALPVLANLEHRMALSDPDNAAELRKSAADRIDRAEALLGDDPTDARNRARLLLAKANQALYSVKPSISRARTLAKETYDFAVIHGDKLMMARARMKQAMVEQQAAARDAWEDNPTQVLWIARNYADEANTLANEMNNDRLKARCHIVLGNLYLADPFRDIRAATQEYDAAVQCMAEHEDSDYVVEQIRALGRKLGLAPCDPADAVIFTVTSTALDHPLEQTVWAVERAVIVAALKHFGDNNTALCRTLGIGRDRIEKHLSAPAARGANKPIICDPDAPAVFRVRTSLAFTRPLEDTIQMVERAVIQAACILDSCDTHAVRKRLHIGHDRFHRHFASLEPELRAGSSSVSGS